MAFLDKLKVQCMSSSKQNAVYFQSRFSYLIYFIASLSNIEELADLLSYAIGLR